MDVTPQVANNWKRRGVSESGVLQAQRLFGTSATWITDGKGPKAVTNQLPAKPPSEGLATRPVAQDLSHPEPDHEPPKYTWEFMLSAVIANLPKRFRVPMPDDALAPDTPRGTVLVFERDTPPTIGHGVLVQDATGQRHVRRYTQGLGGQWKAEARNRAYLTLDSADGVQLLAVVVGRETGEV